MSGGTGGVNQGIHATSQLSAFLICFRKFFGFGQFTEFESLRFAQFDLFFHVKYCFTAAVADMDVNWTVLVAVKEKPVSVFLENRGHGFDCFNQ
jgi:hypothetical protein